MRISDWSSDVCSSDLNMPVPTRNGGTVPLSVVAEIGFGAGPTQINRTNQVRQLTIGADLAPGLVTGQAMEKVEALPALKKIGRAHVWTPVTNAHLVCRLLLEKKKNTHTNTQR